MHFWPELVIQISINTVNDKRLHYTALCVQSQTPFDAYDLEPSLTISKLSTVNIFVGANNSGKSRFLRGLFRTTQFDYTTNFFNGNEFRDFIIKFESPYVTSALLARSKPLEFEPSLIKHYLSSSNGFFHNTKTFTEQIKVLVQTSEQVAQDARHTVSPIYPENSWLATMISKFFEEWRTKTSDPSFQLKIGGEKRFYIPILRGMRSISGTNANGYAERTAKDYFSDSNELRDQATRDRSSKVKLFTGLELYTDLRKKLLGEPEERKSVRDFEFFLQTQFFDGKAVTLIPREGQDVVHVKIGNEKQLPIPALGDGLQNLIIITYEIFMHKERCMFFIEEPDLSMHPGMQRALLEVMTQHNHHQYFLTTHSNHLLDMSSEFNEVSIYLFSKEIKESESRFSVKQASSPDSNILKELGVHNSSVFLTNATIWVEGITDRLYLRAYLKKYFEQQNKSSQRKTLREDYHYSFVEYQGSNLTHWTFDKKDQSPKIKASYLCGHSFLIADGDVSNKGTRKKDYANMLGDRFHILECKEIENLIPVEVLKELVKEEFQSAKTDIKTIKYSKYSTSNHGLGKYLDKLLGRECFGTKTETIANKVNFCEKAIEIMARKDFAWELTPQLNELCEKIYRFVLKQNS